MLLAELLAASETVASTRSRLAKIDALSACLRKLERSEIALGVAYLSGDTGRKVGVGYAGLKGAFVASAAASPQLTLVQIDESLARISELKGSGSAAERARLLSALFARATAPEQDFLARLLLGELRQGALEGLVLDAVAKAANLASARVRAAAMRAGGLPAVAQAALVEGESGLARFSLTVFRPVQPMLAQAADDVAGALERLGGLAAFEWKLDGARVQAHKSGAEIRVYTRSLNEVTAAVPEVIAVLREAGGRELIADGETIALKVDGTPHPFQETMRRFGRRLDVEALRATHPLSVYFFDCLFADGEDLTQKPARERFEALARFLPRGALIPRLVTGDRAAAQAFYDEALARGHEGVMVKAVDAPYEAGSRGAGWLKIKKANTLDLVVIAVEWGSGRRKGWLSNLHLGALDPANGEFVMLGKTFKGMTDKMLAWQTERLLALETSREGHVVRVRPELVVEIAFNEIQASPTYPGGFALRFARVKRYREDKSAREADTIAAVRAIYERQRGA